MSWISLFGLDPQHYQPHLLHDADRQYAETNCYVDVLIELIASSGRAPEAMLGGALAIDFEGDQWTFFKPGAEEVLSLYGMDIHEMQLYRALTEHIATQLGQRRTVIVELDAWYLPDTASTSYHREHVKTSVIVEAIDLAGERLRYFHNRGLFELRDADFRGVLALDRTEGRAPLPPYVELVRFDAGACLGTAALAEQSLRLLRAHLGRRPPDNPFERFGPWLSTELPSLRGGAVDFHGLAFAAVRMAGAAFELAAAQLGWLFGEQALPAVRALSRIVDLTKALSFRLARGRPFDTAAMLTSMASAWEEAMTHADLLVTDG